jgi:hypothetical protein
MISQNQMRGSTPGTIGGLPLSVIRFGRRQQERKRIKKKE